MDTSLRNISVWPDSVWHALTVLIFVSLVSIASYFLIEQQKQFLLEEKQKEISTIADLKSSQLVQWRKERIAEGASIRANAMMADRIHDCFTNKDNQQVRREIRQWLATLVDLGEYGRGILFDPKGVVITADSELKFPPSQHYLDLVSSAASDHELLLSDFHSDGGEDPYDINLAVPIMQTTATKSVCIAVLVLDIDPTKRLYPLIQSWPTTSPTAETLLVMREGDSVLFLNNLRHRKNTSQPLRHSLSQKNMPAVKAALGLEESFAGVDYRNTEVLATTRNIPGTKWGIVAKIDISEVLSPLSKNVLIIAVFGGIITVTMVLALFLWGGRRKAEALRKLVEIEQKHNIELKKSEDSLETQIKERTSDLSEINLLLRQEIIEREQLEQRLLSAKRLEAIGQIAGGVAHEVRNPLNAILTITEALFREQEIASNPEFEPFIQHIRTQVNRLVHLMNDLLDLGRTLPETSMQPLSLVEVCLETIDLWKSTGLSINKQCILTSDDEDCQIRVFADPLRLQQVFFNLLENAENYSADGSKIMMQIKGSAYGMPRGMAVVQITDMGIGIAEDKLPHVFEPFYTDRKGGTGLGLALVKHFIENMGGLVRISNNIPSPGCTAEVHIPLYREEL